MSYTPPKNRRMPHHKGDLPITDVEHRYKRVSGTKWLKMSSLQRQYYKPMKLTSEEKEDLENDTDYVSQLRYQEVLINKARLKWAVLHTSKINKDELLRVWGDPEYKGTYEGSLKRAASNLLESVYGSVYKDDNIGWYINAAYDSGIDDEYLKRLDALAQVLDKDEMNQLINELPDLNEYYVAKGKSAEETDDMIMAWEEELDKTLDIYEDYIKTIDTLENRRRMNKYNNIIGKK